MAPAPAPAPDVEITARVQAREVTVEQDGPVQLRLQVEPGITDIKVERSQPAGATSYRNLVIDARVAAWLRQDDEGNITVQTEGSTGEPPR